MMEGLMDAVPSPRRLIPVLGALAVVCLIALVLAEPGTTASSVTRALTAGASFVLAGVTIVGADRESSWPGQRSLGLALITVGGAAMPSLADHQSISSTSDTRRAKPRALPKADRISPPAMV